METFWTVIEFLFTTVGVIFTGGGLFVGFVIIEGVIVSMFPSLERDEKKEIRRTIATVILAMCITGFINYATYHLDKNAEESKQEEIAEIVSEYEYKIEELKERISYYENGEGWNEDGRTEELYDVIWNLEEFLYNEGYDLEWYYYFEP